MKTTFLVVMVLISLSETVARRRLTAATPGYSPQPHDPHSSEDHLLDEPDSLETDESSKEIEELEVHIPSDFQTRVPEFMPGYHHKGGPGLPRPNGPYMKWMRK